MSELALGAEVDDVARQRLERADAREENDCFYIVHRLEEDMDLYRSYLWWSEAFFKRQDPAELAALGLAEADADCATPARARERARRETRDEGRERPRPRPTGARPG